MNLLYSTFSIVARDSSTGQIGVAATSKFFAVGSGVSWAEAGVGAIATQAYTNVTLGREGLRLMRQGASAQDALDQLLRQDEGRDKRQVGIVDSSGRVAAFTGKNCPWYATHLIEQGVACQGNLLEGKEVVLAMLKAYQASKENLDGRLLAALRAGQTEGGDRRGRQSAVLMVLNRPGIEKEEYGRGRLGVDLRVDDSVAPLDELERLLKLHRLYFQEPKESDYVPIDSSVARQIQTFLSAIGIYKQKINASYDQATQDALARFLWQENLTHRLHDNTIDKRVLRFIEEDNWNAKKEAP